MNPICRTWHIVLLTAIICWSCAVSFGQPVRVERAYREAAVGSVGEYDDAP